MELFFSYLNEKIYRCLSVSLRFGHSRNERTLERGPIVIVIATMFVARVRARKLVQRSHGSRQCEDRGCSRPKKVKKRKEPSCYVSPISGNISKRAVTPVGPRSERVGRNLAACNLLDRAESIMRLAAKNLRLVASERISRLVGSTGDVFG